MTACKRLVSPGCDSETDGRASGMLTLWLAVAFGDRFAAAIPVRAHTCLDRCSGVGQPERCGAGCRLRASRVLGEPALADSCHGHPRDRGPHDPCELLERVHRPWCGLVGRAAQGAGLRRLRLCWRWLLLSAARVLFACQPPVISAVFCAQTRPITTSRAGSR